MATATKYPITDHLWHLGFTLKSKAERLPLNIPTDEGELVTTFQIEALPERGEARRHFSRKGPARAELKTNVPIETLQHEREQGDLTLRHIYTEKCAAILLEMLTKEAPTLSQPKVEVPA